MTKKQTTSYPAPQPELAAAILEVQTVAGKLARITAAVNELPAKTAQADTDLADLSQRLAEAETNLALEDGDTSDLLRVVESLTTEFAAKRAARDRLDTQLPILNHRGEAINVELEAAKQELRAQRGSYANAVLDVVSEEVIEAATNLSRLSAAYRALAVAAGLRTDWLSLAHISDPRRAISIHAGGRTYDDAPNLLNAFPDVASSAVAAMQSTLEPLASATKLVEVAPYRSRNVSASTVVLRSSSEGPGGRADAPARWEPRQNAVQTEPSRPNTDVRRTPGRP